MEFKHDPTKRALNKEEHGIDFKEAQQLWQDPKLEVFPGNSDQELRLVVIGLINSNHWCVMYALRGETIRIISARRARANEIRFYES